MTAPMPNPAKAPPMRPMIPFPMLRPSWRIDVIDEIKRDTPIPAIMPPRTPCAGFRFFLNAKYPPSAPPANAPPIAPKFPKFSPSLIWEAMDMTIKESPRPTTAPSSIPPAQVRPSFLAKSRPSPAPASAPPAAPFRMFSHVSPSPKRMSFTLSISKEIPTVNINPPSKALRRPISVNNVLAILHASSAEPMGMI